MLLLAVGGSYLTESLRRPAAPRAGDTLPAVHAGQKRVTLEVSGMLCASCASRVTRELESTQGVVACEVDVDAQRATVVCERSVADTSLVGAVARADHDFTATVVRR